MQCYDLLHTFLQNNIFRCISSILCWEGEANNRKMAPSTRKNGQGNTKIEKKGRNERNWIAVHLASFIRPVWLGGPYHDRPE